MLINIDQQTAAKFSLRHEVDDGLFEEHRRYYTAGGNRLAILVLRNGLDLATIFSQVADSAVGWKKVAEPIARPEDAGEFHITITCYRTVLNAYPHGQMGRIHSLSSILKEAPKRTS